MILALFTIFLILSIFASGTSIETTSTAMIISIPAIFLGLTYIIRSGNKIKFPKYFFLIMAFVVIQSIYIFFVKNKINPLQYALVFEMSLFYWLIFYNLKSGSRILKTTILSITLIYSFLYLFTKISGINLTNVSQLFFVEGLSSRHYHIGDLWAFVIIMIIASKWGRFSYKQWFLVGLGLIFLIISNSRSAYLSLVLGFLYLINKMTITIKNKQILVFLILSFVSILFIYSSTGRTTLFSRPYFFQSIESFSKYPLGLGMGNFSQISHEYYDITKEVAKVSIYTHNIYLETLSGIGLFSIIFLIFLIRSLNDIFKANSSNIIWAAFFLSITINFMFDTTYAIHGIIWLWFMSLGVFQHES